MAVGDRTPQVTDRTYYRDLACIWLFFTFVLFDQASTERSWPTLVQLAASVLMLVVYTVMSFRGKDKRSRESN
jgi:hypothetical protein